MNSAQKDPVGTTRVTPIDIPQRTDLWYRIALATAVLNHRPLTEDTAAVLLAILDGKRIEDLT
jgi:hypothetical protein